MMGNRRIVYTSIIRSLQTWSESRFLGANQVFLQFGGFLVNLFAHSTD